MGSSSEPANGGGQVSASWCLDLSLCALCLLGQQGRCCLELEERTSNSPIWCWAGPVQGAAAACAGWQHSGDCCVGHAVNSSMCKLMPRFVEVAYSLTQRPAAGMCLQV